MAKKPTYEELEQKIWKLEQQLAELNQTLSTLGEDNKIFRPLPEGEFKRTNDTLRTLFNSLPGIINVVDTDFNVLDVSSGFMDAFSKLEQKQVIGQKCYKVHKKRDSICPECLVKRVYESGKPEIRFSTPEEDKITGWSFKVFGYPIKDNKGNITGAVEFALDITDIKQAERALRESEEKFRTLADFSPIAISISRGEQLLYVNSAWEELTGYNKEEALSLNPLIIVHPDMRELVRQRGLDRVQGKEVPLRYEMKVITKSGDIKWVDFSATVIDYDGEPAVLSSANNITERKQAEQLLQASEERYRGLVNNMQDIVHSVSADGTILFIGPQVERYGFTEEALVSQPFTDLIHPEDREAVQRDFQITISTAKQMNTEFRIIAKDGSVVWFEETGQVVRDVEGNIIGISGILRDVSEKKLAEEALRDSERKLHAIFDHHYQLTGLIDTDGRLLAANRTAMRFAGAEESEVIGRYFWDGPWWDPSQRSELRNAIELAVNGEFVRFETTHPTEDGEIRNIDFSLSPIRDDDGNVIYIVPEGRDITEIRRTEEEKTVLQGQLIQAQKMEAIGTLAGGIAHDFNNILGAILGYSEIIKYSKLPENSDLQDDLEQILNATNRAKDLVQQILAFSRQAEQEKKPILIDPIVKEALKLLRASMPTTINIRQNIQKADARIMGDPTQIHQIIMNLCTNAGHAMQESGGELEVNLAEVAVDSRQIKLLRGLSPGSYLRLTVSDTGPGIAPDLLGQIFNPYFTTKEKGEGTGLGLAVVHGIVKSHGGEITVDSQLGRGTSFHIYVPLAEKKISTEIDAEKQLPTGQGRILFIDDENALAQIGKHMLEGLGYEVETRISSLEALELFRANPQRFDLVVTDMTMPGMTGIQLAREFVRIRPEIPIILCTGFSEQLSVDAISKAGIKDLLMKPFSTREIAVSVKKVLTKKFNPKFSETPTK